MDLSEKLLFTWRRPLLLFFALLTLLAAWSAAGLTLRSSFENLLPQDHPYIETFQTYRSALFGADQIVVVLRQRDDGETIWNADFFRAYHDLTQVLFHFPGVDRPTVTSLWTPNTRFYAVSKDGISARDVIPGTVTANALDDETLAEIRHTAIEAGLIKVLVAKDERSALIRAELLQRDYRSGETIDYVTVARQLESQIRAVFETPQHSVHILGFAPLVGEIAAATHNVLWFFVIATAVTFVMLLHLTRSIRLILLPIFCSGIALTWLFGLLSALGKPLDPLILLAPFVIFAIGVSHGVQQVNRFQRTLSTGKNSEAAARDCFRSLFKPGLLALITDCIGFATLYLMPVPLVRDLALIAAPALLLIIVTGLIVLPLLLAEITNIPKSAPRQLTSWLTMLVTPKRAPWLIGLFTLAAIVATLEGLQRPVGATRDGVSELAANARYNQDFRLIRGNYSAGLHYLLIVFEAPPNACIDPPIMSALDDLGQSLQRIDGVTAVFSAASFIRAAHRAWNNNDNTSAMPQTIPELKRALAAVPEDLGWLNRDCSVMTLRIALDSLEATRIERLVAAAEAFTPPDGTRIRLALGDAGLAAAINQTLDSWEEWLLGIVYFCVLIAIMIAYRNWRILVICGFPLLLTTAYGYGFLSGFEIGLKVTTLPVLILMVGIGVDYAFYLHDRIAYWLSSGMTPVMACQHGIDDAGSAVFHAAAALAAGVIVWVFSPLQLQADMGLLFAFMLFASMITALTLVPALTILMTPPQANMSK